MQLFDIIVLAVVIGWVLVRIHQLVDADPCRAGHGQEESKGRLKMKLQHRADLLGKAIALLEQTSVGSGPGPSNSSKGANISLVPVFTVLETVPPATQVVEEVSVEKKKRRIKNKNKKLNQAEGVNPGMAETAGPSLAEPKVIVFERLPPPAIPVSWPVAALASSASLVVSPEAGPSGTVPESAPSPTPDDEADAAAPPGEGGKKKRRRVRKNKNRDE